MIGKKAILIIVMVFCAGFFITGLGQAKFSITVDAGYSGAFALADTAYGMTDVRYRDLWDRLWITINSEGNISPSAAGSVVLGGSLDLMFSDAIGMSLGFHTLKQKVDVVNDYFQQWTWGAFLGGGGNDSGAYTGSDAPPWDTTGSISVMPITLDLVFKRDFSPTFSAGGALGPAVFLAKADVDAAMGYQGTAVFYPIYYLDLYRVNVSTNEASETLFGAHFQGFIEIKFSPRFAFLVAGNYYFSAKKDVSYEVVNQNRWDGLFGQLYRTTPPDIDIQSMELNVSFFSFNAGIRIYLN